MAIRKVGRPRADSMKLQLALPKYLGDWVEQKSKRTKFCSRQDFILGVLEEQMRKEEGNEQLELGL